AAHAYDRSLAVAGVGEPGGDFVAQGAAAGHDPHGAGLVDVVGHDADLALARRDDAEGVGPDDRRPAAAGEGGDFQGVLQGHVLSDGHHQLDARVDGLKGGISGEGSGHEQDGGGGPVQFYGLLHGVVDGDPMDFLAFPAGGHARHDAGAVLQHLARMEAALVTGDALDYNPNLFIQQDRHQLPPPRASSTTRAAASSMER